MGQHTAIEIMTDGLIGFISLGRPALAFQSQARRDEPDSLSHEQ
jgi:hypothetical protein